MTLLAVVSDTHGHVENTRAAAALLAERQVDRVIHCGDIGASSIPPVLAAWSVDYVLGNVDRDDPALREAIKTAGHRLHGRFGSLVLDGKKIAFLHSDDERLFRETTASGAWDLVCYGHTHHAKLHRVGNTFVLNPGALYRAATHTVAWVTLPELAISHESVATKNR